MTRHYRGDRILDAEEGAQYPIFALHTDEIETTAWHCFESQDELLAWASPKGFASQITTLAKSVEEVSSYRDAPPEDLEFVRDRTVQRCRRSIDDIQGLADRWGMRVASRDFQERMASRLEYPDGPIADPLTLFEDFDQKGSWWHFPGAAYPDLRWFRSPTATEGGTEWRDWNDRARSYIVSGFAVVYEDIWFQGQARHLIGPLIGFGNLEDFDLTVSSLSVL